MFELEKREVIQTGMKLDRYGLIALSGGNVSVRLDNGCFLVTPSGMIYEDMAEDDILVLDANGTIVEGKRRVSVDEIALRYIFQHRTDVHAIIHTHQPYATALGLIQDKIECNLSTLANAVRGAVSVAPYSCAASIQMGIEAVEHLHDELAVVLKHHGVLAIGSTLKEALYACVYLEEASKTIIAAKSCGMPMALMSKEQIAAAVEVFQHYGQDKT